MGEALYLQIAAEEPELAGKLTGMFLQARAPQPPRLSSLLKAQNASCRAPTWARHPINQALSPGWSDDPYASKHRSPRDARALHAFAATARQVLWKRGISPMVPWGVSTSSASVGLADYSQVVIPGSWYKSVNYGERRGPVHQTGEAMIDCDRGRTCQRAPLAPGASIQHDDTHSTLPPCRLPLRAHANFLP